MSLINQAKNDTAQIVGNSSEFGTRIELTAPNGAVAVVVGVHAKHHTGFDENGQPINTTIASIAVSEQHLVAASYPVRTNNEVNLTNHKVWAADSTGVSKSYAVVQWLPDETVGLIILILGKHA